MAFKLNKTVYAHSDAGMVVTPREGGNEGIPFELKAIKSLKWELGAGSTQLEGFAIGPEGIAPTAAKPKWSAELSKVAESMALAKHLGPGAVAISCDVTITWQRKGLPTTTIGITETLITEGLGGQSDAGSAPSGSIGGNCVDILQNGMSLLNRPPSAS